MRVGLAAKDRAVGQQLDVLGATHKSGGGPFLVQRNRGESVSALGQLPRERGRRVFLLHLHARVLGCEELLFQGGPAEARLDKPLSA